MNAWELKHRQKLVEWQEKVAACRSSGLQVRAWCSQEGISVQTYYRWEREIVGRVGTKAAQESRELSIEAGYAVEKGVPPTFVEVPAAARAKVENSRLQAVIRTGRTLVEVYEGASGEVISAIIRGLNHAE